MTTDERLARVERQLRGTRLLVSSLTAVLLVIMLIGANGEVRGELPKVSRFKDVVAERLIITNPKGEVAIGVSASSGLGRMDFLTPEHPESAVIIGHDGANWKMQLNEMKTGHTATLMANQSSASLLLQAERAVEGNASVSAIASYSKANARHAAVVELEIPGKTKYLAP